MGDSDTPWNHSSWIRDRANLVDRVFARGPKRVADELAERVPDTADPASAPGGLRRLLLTVRHRTVSWERGGDWAEEVVLTLWDVATGEQVASTCSRTSRREETGIDHPGDLVVGRALLAWCGGGVVALHDARTLEPLSRTRVTGDLNRVAFSPDERSLAVTGDAGVRVYDVVGGEAFPA
ncbi:WD40 repeat domain-containing protein [Nocardiopsis halotolerans]|uniref:WD40 repeat domain-containing protein n=1 Tax=Nocardiopsis halotolerans TaxID=124252 RepID=UPI00034C18C4|nr:WD40 repeat domain-containing protein [Nocardiopsis halotolerans]